LTPRWHAGKLAEIDELAVELRHRGSKSYHGNCAFPTAGPASGMRRDVPGGGTLDMHRYRPYFGSALQAGPSS
jgi:hypothetical protein